MIWSVNKFQPFKDIVIEKQDKLSKKIKKHKFPKDKKESNELTTQNLADILEVR